MISSLAITETKTRMETRAFVQSKALQECNMRVTWKSGYGHCHRNNLDATPGPRQLLYETGENIRHNLAGTI